MVDKNFLQDPKVCTTAILMHAIYTGQSIKITSFSALTLFVGR